MDVLLFQTVQSNDRARGISIRWFFSADPEGRSSFAGSPASRLQAYTENDASLVAGTGRAGSTDVLGARYPLASCSVSAGRVSHRFEMPEPQMLFSAAVQRDAAMRER